MYTSCFSRYTGENGISIAIKAPNSFHGKSFPPLFPKWDFLNKYKKDGDATFYTKCYEEQVLSVLNPQRVYDDLADKALLCWEAPGQFCHRRLVAEWLQKSLNVSIPEF